MSGCLGTGRQGKVGVYEEAQEIFRSGGYLHYLDCGDSFMGVYTFKLIKLYTLNTCRRLCANRASIELAIK